MVWGYEGKGSEESHVEIGDPPRQTCATFAHGTHSLMKPRSVLPVPRNPSRAGEP